MTDPALNYPYFEPRRRNGPEAILRGNGDKCATLADYWAWSSSDLISNIERGVFAEFLVALALGKADHVRDPWAPYDVQTAEGWAIEVKSAAHIQRWAQKKLTPIKFGIGPTKRWDPEVGAFVETSERQSDVYVFCLLAHKDQATIDPLNSRQWDFLVLATAALDRNSLTQKSITLEGLRALGATETTFEGIADAVGQEATVSGIAGSPPVTIESENE